MVTFVDHYTTKLLYMKTFLKMVLRSLFQWTNYQRCVNQSLIRYFNGYDDGHYPENIK